MIVQAHASCEVRPERGAEPLARTGQIPDRFHSTIGPAAYTAAPSIEARTPPPLPLPAASGARPTFYMRYGKRALDVALGAMLVVALLPLFAAVAVAVLITSGWPIFYGSQRAGLGGRMFPMWKFRTMVRDADAVFERWKETHPERARALLTDWRLEDDPRVTALGRFLRRSSLDELPQFWNVLCGEMSIVGPRPYLSREAIDPALAQSIVSVRPGLTGPFQVCGRKSLKPLSRVQMEAGYAPHVTFVRDAGYMFRTVKPLITLDGH